MDGRALKLKGSRLAVREQVLWQEDLHTAVFEQECLIQMLIFVFDNNAVPMTDCML